MRRLTKSREKRSERTETADKGTSGTSRAAARGLRQPKGGHRLALGRGPSPGRATVPRRRGGATKGRGRICGAFLEELAQCEGSNWRAVRRGLRRVHGNVWGPSKTAACGFGKKDGARGEMPSSGNGWTSSDCTQKETVCARRKSGPQEEGRVQDGGEVSGRQADG